MSDIAKIGFSVETSQLEKGISTLNTLGTASKSANNSVKSFGLAFSESAKVFAGAVAGMSKSISSLVSVTKGATTEQIAAAKQASEFADKIYNAALAQDKLAASTKKVTTAIKGQTTALKTSSKQRSIDEVLGIVETNKKAETSYNVFKEQIGKDDFYAVTGQTPRDMMPNRFNTANIAAQFQDIGVTAAMGMNPMLVALQQGTQLSAVFNSMQNPIRGLADAFMTIINPVSLLTIGLTALTVVGLQAIDWISVAESGLQLLAKGFDLVAEYAGVLTAILGVGLAALTAYTIALGITNAGLIATTASAIATKAAMLALNGVKAVGTMLAALGTAIMSPWVLIPAVIIGVVEAFAYFRDGIKKYVEKAIDVLESFINKAISLFTKFKDAVSSVWDFMQDRASGKNGVESFLSIGTSFLTEPVNKTKVDLTGVKETVTETVDDVASGVDKINGAVSGAFASVSNVLSGAAGSASDKLKEWANGLRETEEESKKVIDTWKNLRNEAQATISSLQLDQRLIGAGVYESEYLKRREDMMTKAQEGGINVYGIDKETGKTYIAIIEDMANTQARLTDENYRLADSFNTSKSITNSFFQDMRQGLFDGADAWETFGNAVLNVLDNILGKMMDVGVDYLFESIGNVGTAGQSQKFSWGSVASSIGSWFSGVEAADGGTFTNGIYKSPTFFKFAKGGQFGVMGEAGPEAVLPLHRSSDGSLGVKAENMGGSDVIVNVYNNSDTQVQVNKTQDSQGTKIDVLIDNLVAEKMSQPGTSSNSALAAFNNRRLIRR